MIYYLLLHKENSLKKQTVQTKKQNNGMFITTNSLTQCVRIHKSLVRAIFFIYNKGRLASRLFSVSADRWWNKLPLDVQTAESLKNLSLFKST